MFVKSILLITLFNCFFAQGSSATECDFNIVEFLKRELIAGNAQGAPGKVDFDSIRKRIESGELKLNILIGENISL
jgi:uncharacterized protein YjhX (UPF0386 family)